MTTPGPETQPLCPSCGNPDIQLQIRVPAAPDDEHRDDQTTHREWFLCNECHNQWPARSDETP
jgi:hypothetical protein